MAEAKAIPLYEIELKSNELLTDSTKLIRLSENETANVSCSIYDSGFNSSSLILLKNGEAVKNAKQANSITYQIKNYSNYEINFECSATRLNGKYQTRKMKVAPRLVREILDNEKPCEENICLNNGLCIKSAEHIDVCICPPTFTGKVCQYSYHKNDAAANPNYLYASLLILFIVAFIFALLYGRENCFRVKRKKTKKTLMMERKSMRRNNDNNSLQHYEVCDGREDVIYEEQKIEQTIDIVNEYDNVPSTNAFQSRPLIKNQKRQNLIGITEEVAQGQIRETYANISKPVKPPLAVDL